MFQKFMESVFQLPEVNKNKLIFKKPEQSFIVRKTLVNFSRFSEDQAKATCGIG